jgi:hypothetical protein
MWNTANKEKGNADNNSIVVSTRLYTYRVDLSTNNAEVTEVSNDQARETAAADRKNALTKVT